MIIGNGEWERQAEKHKQVKSWAPKSKQTQTWLGSKKEGAPQKGLMLKIRRPQFGSSLQFATS